jgi:hypothetical protein
MAELVRIDPPGRKPPRASPLPPGRRGYLVRGTIAPVFVERHALAPQDAIGFAPRSPREAKAFAAMKARGVVRAAGSGWWLDMVAYQADAEARSRTAVPWLIGASIAVATMATMFFRG